MKTTNKQFFVATIIGASLCAAAPLASATDFSKHQACESVGYTQMQNLKLAAKAQQGVTEFVRYVNNHRMLQNWTLESAIERAQAAAVTPCAVALGIPSLDQPKAATMLAQNSR